MQARIGAADGRDRGGLIGLERERVAAWLDEYSGAWQSYDGDAIGELFSEDATYRYHPWDEPLRGRAAIVASWVGDQDPPGTYEGRYQPLAVDGDLAVATGRSRYFAPDGSVEREYPQLLHDAVRRRRPLRRLHRVVHAAAAGCQRLITGEFF